MRYKIAFEGGEAAPGFNHILNPGSLTWNPDKSIPVTVAGNLQPTMFVESYIGWATDIQREEGGWLTAEIELNSRYIHEDLDHLGATVWCERVEPKNLNLKERPWVIEKAEIKSIFFTVGVPWAKDFNVVARSVEEK